jgi:hypothetical protein
MKRTMLALTVVLLGGLFAMWFVDSNEADLAAAAFHSSVAATPTQNITATAQPDKSSVLLVQDGRTPVPGGPIVPQIAPRSALPPKFPAEAVLPAELLQSQKLSATPSPLQSFPNTFEGRMGKLNLFSRTNALPPPPSAPPEMQMFGRMMAPPNTPPRPTPTINQLRGYLLAEPGGREILEEAKRRGFLRSRRSPDDESSSFSLAHLLRPAEAQAAEGFKAVFTPREPKNSGLTLVAIWLWEAYKPVLDAGIRVFPSPSPLGSSWAVFNVTVPRDGMYWVDVIAFASNVHATLVKAGNVVNQHYYGPGPNTYDYFALVHLAQGSHTFFWYVSSGTAQFIEASVQEDS